MTAYEDMDEELRRIMDEGSASARPAELAELRAQIPPEPMGEELPKGTKVVFAEQDLPVAAPPPSRTPITPKVIDLTSEPMDDMEMAAARVEDRQARSREAFERGTRQLIGGLTRTQALPTTPEPTDAVAQLLAKRREREAQRQHENQQRLGAQKVDFDRQEAARKAALHEQERKEDLEGRDRDDKRADEGLQVSREGNEATRDLARATYALKKEEHETKKKANEDKEAAGSFPLADGTFTLKKGLDDSAANKARSGASSWNTAIGNLDDLEGSLAAYVKNPSLETKATVEAQLQGAMTALNVAYGQGAMAENEARALSQALGADLKSPTAIAAAIQSWMGGDPAQAGKLLMTKIRTVRGGARNAAIKSLSVYGDFAGMQAATSPDEDAAAVEWAKTNKSDPRAAEILRLHGVK